MYNAGGELQFLQRNDQEQEQIEIDTKNLQSGIYFVRVVFENGNTPYSRKIIIQHR